MRIVLIIAAILSLNSTLNAQHFAVINDKDGFVNVRQDKSASSRIVGKIYPSTIFAIESEEIKNSDWIKIYTSFSKNMLEGYIHKSRINALSSFKHLDARFNSSQLATIKNDSLIIEVTTDNFIPKKHKLNSSGGYYQRIDNKPIWGTDGGLPKKAITCLLVKLNGASVFIPKSATTNLFEPNLSTLTVYFGHANTLYIRMDNSDGAGGYTVIWIIKNGKYLSRFLDNSEA